MADCIFCKIMKGELGAQKVFESEKVVAFLDINPVSWGHTLVLPRAHYETWIDLPVDVASALAQSSQVVARGVMKATGAVGFNLLMNNHSCSGQAIAHAHYHVIPRKPDDGVKYAWPAKPYPQGEIEKAAEGIRKALAK
jgi:histidine triad (HIT) family protein